jgi:hypothetical protein
MPPLDAPGVRRSGGGAKPQPNRPGHGTKTDPRSKSPVRRRRSFWPAFAQKRTVTPRNPFFG